MNILFFGMVYSSSAVQISTQQNLFLLILVHSGLNYENEVHKGSILPGITRNVAVNFKAPYNKMKKSIRCNISRTFTCGIVSSRVYTVFV